MKFFEGQNICFFGEKG